MSGQLSSAGWCGALRSALAELLVVGKVLHPRIHRDEKDSGEEERQRESDLLERLDHGAWRRDHKHHEKQPADRHKQTAEDDEDVIASEMLVEECSHGTTHTLEHFRLPFRSEDRGFFGYPELLS